MGISTIRRGLFREQCRFSTWKTNLPDKIKHCPDDILMRSIAYGNDPNEIESIIEDKINSSNSTVGSIEKLVAPLKKLKTDLDRNPVKNLLSDVRNFADSDTKVCLEINTKKKKHFYIDVFFFSERIVYSTAKLFIVYQVLLITHMKMQPMLFKAFNNATMNQLILVIFTILSKSVDQLMTLKNISNKIQANHRFER